MVTGSLDPLLIREQASLPKGCLGVLKTTKKRPHWKIVGDSPRREKDIVAYWERGKSMLT